MRYAVDIWRNVLLWLRYWRIYEIYNCKLFVYTTCDTQDFLVILIKVNHLWYFMTVSSFYLIQCVHVPCLFIYFKHHVSYKCTLLIRFSIIIKKKTSIHICFQCLLLVHNHSSQEKWTCKCISSLVADQPVQLHSLIRRYTVHWKVIEILRYTVHKCPKDPFLWNKIV